jgi:hypothetical protein
MNSSTREVAFHVKAAKDHVECIFYVDGSYNMNILNRGFFEESIQLWTSSFKDEPYSILHGIGELGTFCSAYQEAYRRYMEQQLFEQIIFNS